MKSSFQVRHGVVLSLLAVLSGCATVQVDNGQPKMEAAMVALGQAKAQAEAATPNKGGHREAALGLIQQAINEVNAGMEYARAHPTEIGETEAVADPEPVNEVVAGAENQPHMAQAIVQLREAIRQLREAKHDKGGHRKAGIQFSRDAIKQLQEGIRFANTGH